MISVDADPDSLKCLKLNLKASECDNVTICGRPVAQKGQKVCFGPRGNILNESVSYVKTQSDNALDSTVQAITFKQLIHDYVYTNAHIASKPISFIKCDIEGGEEDIIEDMLYFAYYNKSKVYLSFHLDWWKSKKITDFKYLFKFFKTNCPSSDVCAYIEKNPFTSLLFEPINTQEILIKKNMPVVIIGYNQFTFIKNMVQQLEKYTSDIIIVDNNSSFNLLLDYYQNEFQYTLIRKNKNYGHRVYLENFIQNLVGDFYLLTDPDLEFNSNLPDNFIDTFIHISNYFNAKKVGFALCIDADDIKTEKFGYMYGRRNAISILDAEAIMWKTRMDYPIDPNLELYLAGMDTTFCLVNRKAVHENQIRVAGNYTCRHIPWHKNFQAKLAPGEYETYAKTNISTTWWGI